MKFKKLIILLIIFSFISGAGGGAFILKYYSNIQNFFSFPNKEDENSNFEIIEKEGIKDREDIIVNTVKKASASVVSIVLTKDVPIYEEYFNDPFQLFPQYEEKGTEKQKVGGGSGIIVSTDGLILTNRHVVEEEDVDYTVITNNGEKYSAKVLARVPIRDLAILKIEENNLSVAKLGDSDKLEPGQTAIAIGYALGELKNTVSVGVISGLGRDISSFFSETVVLDEAIQTDAAINPGNSCGPLLNLSGEVIGINVAMAYGAENIGFTIPINNAKKIIKDVKENGEVSYPFLGVQYILIDENVKKQYNLNIDYGAWVVSGNDSFSVSVTPGSAADIAGIEENDIILEIDNKKITKENSLVKIVLSYSVGDNINIKVLRKGEKINLKAKLGERK